MTPLISKSRSRKVNGYVKAVLALEAVRKKREDRYDRFVRPLDRKRDELAAEVAVRGRALSGGQLAAAQRLLAMITQATAGDGTTNRGDAILLDHDHAPSAVGPRPAGRERAVPVQDPATIAWQSSTPEAPRGLLGRKGQPVDPPVTHRVRAGPASVPAAEARLTRRAIEREDRLLAIPVLEVADVEVGGLGAEGGRDPERRGMAVVNRQHRR